MDKLNKDLQVSQNIQNGMDQFLKNGMPPGICGEWRKTFAIHSEKMQEIRNIFEQIFGGEQGLEDDVAEAEGIVKAFKVDCKAYKNNSRPYIKNPWA